MPLFDPSTFSHRVPVPILSAFNTVWTGLSCPGAWWAGEERLAIAAVARGARPRLLGEPVPPSVISTISPTRSSHL